MRPSGRQLTQEPEVLATHRRPLGERAREQLDGGHRAAPKIVVELRCSIGVARDLGERARRDRLADLGVAADERLADAAHRFLVHTWRRPSPSLADPTEQPRFTWIFR